MIEFIFNLADMGLSNVANSQDERALYLERKVLSNTNSLNQKEQKEVETLGAQAAFLPDVQLECVVSIFDLLGWQDKPNYQVLQEFDQARLRSGIISIKHTTDGAAAIHSGMATLEQVEKMDAA